MAEEQVTYTTTTTTTTTRSSEVISVGFNVGFLRTPIGILMVLEIIFGLIAWALLVSGTRFYYLSELEFAAFGFIFSWIITLILFFVFLMGFHGSLCANLPWGMIQVALNGLFALLYFIASCCVASVSGKSHFKNWSASTAFGFIVTVLYIISLLFCFRKAYGRFPWQTATGAPTNT